MWTGMGREERERWDIQRWREKPKKGNRRKGFKTERRYAGQDKEAEK